MGAGGMEEVRYPGKGECPKVGIQRRQAALSAVLFSLLSRLPPLAFPLDRDGGNRHRPGYWRRGWRIGSAQLGKRAAQNTGSG